MIAYEIDCAVFQHCIVLTLYHSIYEWLSRVVGGVVLTFVAHSSGTFYLLIDAEFSWLLQPDFILRPFYFHCFLFLFH